MEKIINIKFDGVHSPGGAVEESRSFSEADVDYCVQKISKILESKKQNPSEHSTFRDHYSKLYSYDWDYRRGYLNVLWWKKESGYKIFSGTGENAKELQFSPESITKAAFDSLTTQDKVFDGPNLGPISFVNGKGKIEVKTNYNKREQKHRWWVIDVLSEKPVSGLWHVKFDKIDGRKFVATPVHRIPEPKEFVEKYAESVLSFVTKEDENEWAIKAIKPKPYPLAELIKLSAVENYFLNIDYPERGSDGNRTNTFWHDLKDPEFIKSSIETQYIRGAISDQAAADAWEQYGES